MNGSINLISSTSRGEWLEALEQSAAYDFYHLPFYHDLARELGEGEPTLVVYSDGPYRVLLPLLVRNIKDVPPPLADGQPWYDATSVYGYPGPIASHADLPVEVISGFQALLTKSLFDIRVVSIFSRLHPFINQSPLLSGLGNCVRQGYTVSIDMSISEDAQLAQYRENHRRDIRKLRDRGARCIVDDEFRHMDTFVHQYYETMNRVQAWENYRFPDRYFQKLMSTREAVVKLLACEVDGEILGSGLFLLCRGIVEYHLGGTSLAGQRVGAMKFVLDSARHWGYLHGAKIFHLGGGVGSRDDSLANFKLGFSNRTHSFCTWHWVIRQDVYDALVTARKREILASGFRPIESFFPAYRAPAFAEDLNTNAQEAFQNPTRTHDGRSGGIESLKPSFPQAQPPEAAGPVTNEVEKKRLLILGAGGHAGVIADALLCRLSRGGSYELLGYLDDNPGLRKKKLLGRPVLGTLDDLSRIPHEAVVVGIGDNETRARLFRELTERGETFATVIHPQSIIAHDVKIGRGTVIFAGVIVNTGTIIGENVILNTGCRVDHDCVVGSHVHICPGTSLGGGVDLGEGAFLGIQSTIIHYKNVGAWATVGGGAAVIRDVPPNVTVVGVPARALPPRGVPHKADMRDLTLERIESLKEYL